MQRAVFLDRDGVINEIVYHQDIGVIDSPFTVEQFKLLPEVGEAISLINDLAFKAIVVSNQPGIAKGHFTEQTLEEMAEKMERDLASSNAFLDGVYYCFHHPDGVNRRYSGVCECRKPKPGLFLQAARDFTIDLSRSYMIGDSITDVKAGQAVGCTTVLVGRLKCDLCRLMDDEGMKPDFIVPNLLEAVRSIRREEG